MEDKDVLLSIFVAVESAHAFSAFNPSIFTIRRFPDSQTIQDIKTGCIYASGFSIAIGLLSSGITGNVLPIILAIIVSLVMSSIYMKTAGDAYAQT